MMSRVRAPMTVLQGGGTERRRSPVVAACEHFRLERQGNLVSAATLHPYDDMVLPFFLGLPPEQASSALVRPVYALAKGAVEGDLGEGALENGELLVVQLRDE